jgi:predicted transcriptional regulator of viral defense system
MGRALGKLERQLFAYAQLRRLQTLKLGDLREPLRLSAKQESALYGRLARAGMIAKVRRGLYLVPAQLPLGGKWSPDEAQVLKALIVDQGGRYQITGPNAFNRYGFDEQVPVRTYVYNNRLSGERRVGVVALTLIKVSDERLGDTVEVEAANGAKLVYSSRVRTLVDAIYDWSRFAGLPRAYRSSLRQPGHPATAWGVARRDRDSREVAGRACERAAIFPEPDSNGPQLERCGEDQPALGSGSE